MPGPDTTYAQAEGAVDLYPRNEDEHAALLQWATQAFIAADNARRVHETRWKRFNRLYHSYIKPSANLWNSQLFIPYVFSTIETIVPKVLSEEPKFLCIPIGPEDAAPAKLMETMLDYSAQETDLYVELLKTVKSSLKYGTGILKTYYDQDIKIAWEMVPKMVPETALAGVADENGEPLYDLDGNPVEEEQPTGKMVPVIDPKTGQPAMERQPYAYMRYDGPRADWIDLFHFYVAPEATSIEDARYVIQRMWREKADIQRKIAEGMYHLPPGMNELGDIYSRTDDPAEERHQEEGWEPRNQDETSKPIELWEMWTDDNRKIVVANRTAVLAVSESPFWHGEKPFVALVDYLQEGEFWGVGEAETMEGLQDLENAIVNQRIDNVRIGMDQMYAVHTDAVEDERDLVLRPGGVIRVSGDYLPSEAVYPLPTTDVTGSAFAEAQQIESLIERVTGVTAYTAGTDSDTLNRTATGVALLTEAGNTKFALKVKLMERLGLRRLARHWGSIIQQFTTEERMVRILGPSGQWLFATMSPESVQGALDYSIQPASSTQTETVRKEQAMVRAQTIAQMWPPAVPKLVMDLLEADNVKDFTPYLWGMPDLQMLAQQQYAMGFQEQSAAFMAPSGQGQGGDTGAQQGGQSSQESSSEGAQV